MSIQSLPPVFYCRWSWCYSRHSNASDLARHVIQDHVRKAVPFQRESLAHLERAEEGIGETISLSEHMHGMLRRESSGTPEQLPSSLPTPPGSDQVYPVDNASQLPMSPNARRKRSFSQDTGVDPSLLSGPVHTPVRHISRSRGQHKLATPSFASLSSPEESPFRPNIPSTPEFNDIVDQALHPTKRPRLEGKVTSNLGPIFSSLASQASTSNESMFSVEQHLTQSVDADVSDNELELSDLIRPDKLDETATSLTEEGPSYEERPSAFNMQSMRSPQAQNHSSSMSSDLSMPPPAQRPRELPIQSQSVHSTLPSVLSSQSLPSSEKHTWYGPAQASALVKEESISGESSPQDLREHSQPPSPSWDASPTPPRKAQNKLKEKYVFRSGTFRPSLPLSPPRRRSSLGRASDGELIHLHHPQRESPSLGAVDEHSDDDLESFPPLQTQAAYQSQSMTF